MTLIVGRSEKFADKYVITSINVHVFVWKEFITLDKSRKIRYENYLLFHLCGIITKGKAFFPYFFAGVKTLRFLVMFVKQINLIINSTFLEPCNWMISVS